MMSRKCLFVTLTVFFCILAAKAVAAPPPIVYYKFDALADVVTDASGNGNDGTPNGGITLRDDGKIGKCFEFNGQNAYVDLERVIQDDFTLMAWIKTDQPGVELGAQGYQGSGLMWSDVGGVANDFILAVLGTKLSFFAGNPDLSVNSNQDVVTGDWVHVAAVRSATNRRLSIYINGELENSADHANSNPLNAQPRLHIGGNTLDSRYYTGLVDEVRIFDAALTDEEVLQEFLYPTLVSPGQKLSTTWGTLKVVY